MSSTVTLPPPAPNTPVDSIPSIVEKLRKTFNSRKTTPIAYRKEQLKKLWWAVKDNEQAMIEAMNKDFKKPALESIISDVVWILNDIISMIDNLDKYAKDEKQDVELAVKFCNPYVRKEPMGVILVIGYVRHSLFC